MKTGLLILGLAATTAAALAAAPVVKPAESASPAAAAASRPGAPLNPAVRAAENARTPGELRPREAVVPQIIVPLKRRAAAAPADKSTSAAPVPPGPAINDATARCRALDDAQERAACQRRADATASTPRSTPP